jgi:hypothetical protein
VRWASHRLGRTMTSGPVGHGPTPVRPKSLEFRHFLGNQIVTKSFFWVSIIFRLDFLIFVWIWVVL